MRNRTPVPVLLAALLLAAGAGEAAGAKPGAKASPRLKAFGSCTGLVSYARRNGVRLVRDQARAMAPVLRMPVTGTPPGAGEDGGSGGGGTGGPVPVQAPAAPEAGAAPGSETNVQEAGVDEPDIVKAKGSILFVLSEDGLHTVDASATPPKLLGSLDIRGYGGRLIVHGDRALVMTEGNVTYSGADDGEGLVPPAHWNSRGVLTEVDISDPAALRVVRTLDVEGRVVSSRLTGRTARVVVSSRPRALDMPVPAGAPVGIGGGGGGTVPVAEVRRDWQRSVRRARSARWLPSSVLRSRRTGKRVQHRLVGCKRVRRASWFSGLEMVTVLTIDMRKGLPAIDSDSVMTTGETVYASPKSLYVGTERWIGSDPTLREVRQLSHTAVHKFDISDPDATTYRASGEVPGYLLNQWSLSEQDGVLRVATTDRPSWWDGPQGADSQSAVRTYAERGGRLAELGRVGGLGKGERIFAVRFIGDVGFVVTFRQTDPLYAVDLSNPAAPKLLGELKVPGYSAYLHPIGDDLLLGVGRDATETGTLRGVQISLFDISDLRNPTRLDSRAFGGRWAETEVEQDHHAFLWWQPERLAVVPMTIIHDETMDPVQFGAQGVRVDRANGIRPISFLEHPGVHQGIRRALVVGDRLVTVSAAGVLSSALSTLGDGRFTAFPRAPLTAGEAGLPGRR